MSSQYYYYSPRYYSHYTTPDRNRSCREPAVPRQHSNNAERTKLKQQIPLPEMN